jgi:uncharacterized protein (TIGR00297 family)
MFISVILFVLEASIEDRYHLMLALLVALIISFSSFLLNFLTLDGARAAVMMGLISFGFGGIEAAVVLIGFFLSSNAVGLMAFKGQYSHLERGTDRRNGTQVWSNAFWFSFFICLWYVLKADMLYIAAIGAIATACSDTWGTEFGSRKAGKTVLITTLKVVKPGTDGGISVAGTIAAFMGAAFIGLITVFFDKNFIGISVIAIGLGGFLGSLADSWLGAVYQNGTKRLPDFLESNENKDNNSVNFLATGIGSLLAILIYNTLIYVVV